MKKMFLALALPSFALAANVQAATSLDSLLSAQQQVVISPVTYQGHPVITATSPAYAAANICHALGYTVLVAEQDKQETAAQLGGANGMVSQVTALDSYNNGAADSTGGAVVSFASGPYGDMTGSGIGSLQPAVSVLMSVTCAK